MKVGIVGLPNAGKSTLFNALTRAGAETAVYPFTTVDPNVAVVPVPDERLERVAEAVGASPVVFETIAFHDIAGLVEGAHRGEGLGNRFLGAIRETDAIVHLVRAHEEAGVPHPSGAVDPVADAETVEAELAHAGIEAPTLYVANVAEGEPLVPPPALERYASERGAPAVAVSARIEAELAELDPADAEAMRAELGVEGSGLERVVRATFELLGLVAFFTAHRGAEARARAVPRGTTAQDAARKVHTDMQAGFVRAEVVPWEQLVDAGGYTEARERGLIRTEGRDYEIDDGDVITFKFTP